MRRSSFVSRSWLLAACFGLLSLSAHAQDRREPAAELPGLDAAELPQFVSFTFDDNFSVEGIDWANDLFQPLVNPAGNGVANNYDGTPVRTTFYSNTTYLDPFWDGVPEAWRQSFDDGHEIANHTDAHNHGRDEGYDSVAWQSQISLCTDRITDPTDGVGPTEVVGFRAPYLGYNAATFQALATLGFEYDTTLGTCWSSEQDGSNCLFPYTLHGGSPDAAALNAKFAEPLVGNHPGLWEVPVGTFIVPPDSAAAEYGFTPGLRAKIAEDMTPPSRYEASSGKLGGLDFAALHDAGLSGPEFLAILKYSFDLRYNGNRAPFVVVGHTNLYAGNAGRKQAVADFLTYVLSKPEVRVRPVRDIVEWMRHPKSLTGADPRPVLGTGGGPSASGGSTSGSGGSSALGGQGGAPAEDGGDATGAGCSCRTAPGSRGSVGFAWLGASLAAFTLLRRGRSAARGR